VWPEGHFVDNVKDYRKGLSLEHSNRFLRCKELRRSYETQCLKFETSTDYSAEISTAYTVS
jgi:hypothetical protein